MIVKSTSELDQEVLTGIKLIFIIIIIVFVIVIVLFDLFSKQKTKTFFRRKKKILNKRQL